MVRTSVLKSFSPAVLSSILQNVTSVFHSGTHMVRYSGSLSAKRLVHEFFLSNAYFFHFFSLGDDASGTTAGCAEEAEILGGGHMQGTSFRNQTNVLRMRQEPYGGGFKNDFVTHHVRFLSER
jgi:hypothetical protein